MKAVIPSQTSVQSYQQYDATSQKNKIFTVTLLEPQIQPSASMLNVFQKEYMALYPINRNIFQRGRILTSNVLTAQLMRHKASYVVQKHYSSFSV
jgi:hypothetical protein